MRGRQRAGALVLAVVLGVSLVACGGDDDDTASEDTDAEVTTTEAPADDDGGDDGGDDGDGGDADGSDLGAFSGECAAFAQAFIDAGTAVSEAFTGAPGEDLEALGSYFNEVADDLPDEISNDFRVFAAAYTDFAEALADSDIDFSNPGAVDPDAMAELQTISEAFNSAEVQEASANIEAYMEEQCPSG